MKEDEKRTRRGREEDEKRGRTRDGRKGRLCGDDHIHITLSVLIKVCPSMYHTHRGMVHMCRDIFILLE